MDDLAQHNAEIVRLNAKLRYTQQQLSNRERDLAEVSEALKPFAALADICDYFSKMPEEQICSWRRNGRRHKGPTADDCRVARGVLTALEARHAVGQQPERGTK